MADEVAKVLVRMAETMRRKLKIVAAIECRSMNEQIIQYLNQGISSANIMALSDDFKVKSYK